MSETGAIKKLMQVIESRKEADAKSSYVASLFQGGLDKILGKIREEALEVCDAAVESDKHHLVHEICDLMFHTLVLAAHKDVSLEEIEAEFGKRFGMSGHEEKASRHK